MVFGNRSVIGLFHWLALNLGTLCCDSFINCQNTFQFYCFNFIKYILR
jgi:hypothetical protein